MTYDPTQDERLTAYALGELDDEQVPAVEEILAEHAEARAYVEQVRRTAQVLATELRAEPAVPMGWSAQAGARRALAPATRRWQIYAPLAAAAAVAILIGGWVLMPPLGRARELADSARGNALLPAAPQVEVQSHLKAAREYAQRSTVAAPPPGSAPLPVELPNPTFAGTPKQAPPGTRLAPGQTVAGVELDRLQAEGGNEVQLSGVAGVRNVQVGQALLGDYKDLRTEFYAPGDAQLGLESRELRNGLSGARPLHRPDDVNWRYNPNFHTEAYDSVTDNPFRRVADHPLSTFSIDVDTASYANTRRMMVSGTLPPAGAVRIEEMINYFPYYYAAPGEVVGEHPFITNIEVAGCPWNTGHRLVRVGLQAKEVAKEERPASNLVFLIDVSGSMQPANKLPLVRQSLKMLVDELREDDRVAIVVYAGASGLVLDSTPATRRQEILAAIDRLEAGGSTNGGAGIQLAYQVATSHFIRGGVNRVILATDGDFNVGVTDRSSLVKLIEAKRDSGVFLSVLGFGMGNLKDATMEELSNKGNGNYAYIDSLREARKVLVEQMGGTLVTVAKDVKIQVEFNPAAVAAYRLIGYENRILAKEDFNDDRKDAGEVGAGHTVTALYEVVPAGRSVAGEAPGVDELKYQPKPRRTAPISQELLTLKLRYKQPEGDASTKVEYPLVDEGKDYARASGDFKFAAAVAGFGMILRDSPHKGTLTFDAVLELAQEGIGEDRGGYRAEFIELVRKAKQIAGK